MSVESNTGARCEDAGINNGAVCFFPEGWTPPPNLTAEGSVWKTQSGWAAWEKACVKNGVDLSQRIQDPPIQEHEQLIK